MKDYLSKIAGRVFGHSDGHETLSTPENPDSDLHSPAGDIGYLPGSAAEKAAPFLAQDLIEGIQTSNLEAVKRLIEQGANVNALDKTGRTPLHLATQNGQKDMADLLANFGAELNPEAIARAQKRISTAHANRTKRAFLKKQRGPR